MRIEYETNTLVIILQDKDNLYLVYNTLEEIERLLCKKLPSAPTKTISKPAKSLAWI